MLRSTVQVTLFSIFGIIINFVIQLFLAYFFGASEDRDAYYAAATIPTYIGALFTGSLGMLLVPYFIRHAADAGRKDVNSPVFNFVFLVLSVVAIGASFFSTGILQLMVPAGKPRLLELSAHLFSVLIFGMVFTVLNNFLASKFQSKQFFLAPAFSAIITNVVTLLAVALLSERIGISSIAYGNLAGGVIACLFLLAALHKKGVYTWQPLIYTAELQRLLVAAIPLMLAGILFRSTTLFERFFAARLPEGSLSYLGNGNQIILIMSTIVSTGIATTSFPLLSRHWTDKNLAAMEKTFRDVLNIITVFLLPTITIFIACGEDLVRLLFERGAFTPADTEALYHTLLALMGFLFFSSIGNVVARILYISNHTKVASLIGTMELLLYLIGCIFLTPLYGYVGLALSFSLASGVNVVVSLVYIQRAIVKIDVNDLLKRLLLLSLLSILVLFPVFLLQKELGALNSIVRVVVITLAVVSFFIFTAGILVRDRYYQMLLTLLKKKI